MKKSLITTTVIIVLVTVPGVFLVYTGIAPLNTMREYEKKVMSDTMFHEKYDTLYNYPQISSLVKEKTYKEALLKLSENDSIQLVINIPDSTVSLYIKGVRIHKSKISYYKRDKLFGKIPVIERVYMFSKPIKIISQYSTVIKEPVFTREAPKDTIEAALNAWMPDTVIQEPAFVKMSAEHNIDIILEQEEKPAQQERLCKTRFMYRINLAVFTKNTFNFFTLKNPDYHPQITIKIPAEELRSIYRALPVNSFIVLRVD